MEIEDVFVLSDSDSEDHQPLDVESLVQMTEDVQHHEDALAASSIAPANQLDGDTQDDDRPNSVTSSYLSDSSDEIDVGALETDHQFRTFEDRQEIDKKVANERKRRDTLRKEYTRIKTWLPAGEVYHSKNSILQAAVTFITALKENQYRYECVSEKLFQKNWRLKRRLKRLQSSNAVSARG